MIIRQFKSILTIYIYKFTAYISIKTCRKKSHPTKKRFEVYLQITHLKITSTIHQSHTKSQTLGHQDVKLPRMYRVKEVNLNLSHNRWVPCNRLMFFPEGSIPSTTRDSSRSIRIGSRSSIHHEYSREAKLSIPYSKSIISNILEEARSTSFPRLINSSSIFIFSPAS